LVARLVAAGCPVAGRVQKSGAGSPQPKAAKAEIARNRDLRLTVRRSILAARPHPIASRNTCRHHARIPVAPFRMSSPRPPSSLRPKIETLRGRIIQVFFHGLIVIVPLAVTAATLHWMFTWIDGLLRPYVQIPGLGFVLVLLIVLVTGWISSFLIFGRLFEYFERWLERMPGVKFIYTSVRDFFEAFVGNKRRFNRTVLVNVLAEDVWLIGFLTNEDLQRFELGAEFVSVYVPQAYNVAGQLYLVRRERVRFLEQMESSEAMKYAVTGGAVEVHGRK